MNEIEEKIKEFLNDGEITDSEIEQINELCVKHNITEISIGQNKMFDRLQQAIIIKKIKEGIPFEQISSNIWEILLSDSPIKLLKNEHILWIYPVTMHKQRNKREYKGKSSGVSFRLFKGVSLKLGSFKGNPVDNTFIEPVDAGKLIITNKHIIFVGQQTSYKVPYSKINSIVPYKEDGVTIFKYNVDKSTSFTGFDYWFLFKLMSVL